MLDKVVVLYCPDKGDLVKLQDEFRKRKSNPNNIVDAKVYLACAIIQERQYEEVLEIIAKHHSLIDYILRYII